MTTKRLAEIEREHIARVAQRFNLPAKHFFIAVVVTDRGQRRRVRRKRNCAERPAVLFVSAREFSSEMLSVCGRATIAAQKKLSVIFHAIYKECGSTLDVGQNAARARKRCLKNPRVALKCSFYDAIAVSIHLFILIAHKGQCTTAGRIFKIVRRPFLRIKTLVIL